MSRHSRKPRPRCRPRLEVLEGRLAPAVFTVTSTDDNGGTNPNPGDNSGTLRQAIVDANAHPNSGGPDEIHFDIPGSGVQTIALQNDLPFLDDPVVIDGYTQHGASPNTAATGENAVLLIQ